MTRLALFAGAALAPALFAGAAHADAQSCVDLIGSQAFADTVIEDATWMEAGALEGPFADLPAFCEVWGTIAPVEGSRIGVVYRLPETWNGKVLGLGGGGWNGNIAVQTAADGLSRGYATMQTDTGHPVPAGFGAFQDDWLLDADNQPRWAAIEDFSWRGLHLMTVIGKEVAAAYYGRPHSAAYYQGCSTGGRQGLLEAQRFPDDYVGIIAGAPIINMTVQSSHMVRSNLFSQDPARALTPEHRALVGRAAMAACDGDDGVADGVIDDPFSCDFDPASLACPDGGQDTRNMGADCLSPQQVFAVRTMYEGVTTPDGVVVSQPALAGSEASWRESDGQGTAFEVAQAPSVAVFAGEYGYDARAASPEEIAARVLNNRYGRMQDADDPNLAEFLGNGGRLIVYHGLLDTVANAAASVDWYEEMIAAMGQQGRGQTALFLMPGMDHCGGGPGANSADFLSALEDWVERDVPPEGMIATRAAGGFGPAPAAPLPPYTRPLCAWPRRAVHDGQGDPNDAGSFTCQ